jgi:Ca2+-binding EF-hand superfamily protein
MKTKILTVMIVSSLFTIATYAQEQTDKPKPDKEGMFKRLDTDADGKISKAEADKAEKGMIKEKFADIDTNKDEYINKEELKAYRQSHRQQGGKQPQ